MDSEKILKIVEELGQKEIKEKFKYISPQKQKDFVEQINFLDKACRGRLKDYLKRAKVLLEDSKNRVNAFHEYKIKIPDDIPHIDIGSEEFYELDQLGFGHLKDTDFTLVAGGLGERLEYTGIKIGLQNELITLLTYIDVYTDFMKAYENRIRKKEKMPIDWFIPFCIMTSDDTHDQKISLLKEQNNFGMRTNQIIKVKQDKIPAIADNECHLSLKEDKFLLEIKPHGHGDNHYLLYKSGKAKQWVQEGKKYMVLFMDTYVLAFNCIPVSIGSSVKYGFDVNSVAVPRRAKDVIGIICKLILYYIQ